MAKKLNLDNNYPKDSFTQILVILP